jgi:pimeloyl-ACP methyl ester carboxylesterase
LLASGVGGGYLIAEDDIRFYIDCMRQPGHAVAGSKWYRTFQTRELAHWLRGEYDGARVDVPVRWLSGTKDPVLTPDLLNGYPDRISDFQVELVDGVGHWIVEQRPELVLDRLRSFLKDET